MTDPSFLIILAALFGVMFLMSSRTRKQQKEAAAFRAALAPGQEVMTGSGLFGTVVAVEDDVITLEIAPGVTSRWLRPAIAKRVEPTGATALDEDSADVADPATGQASADSRTTVDDEPRLAVPDDASSLTDDPDPGSQHRR